MSIKSVQTWEVICDLCGDNLEINDGTLYSIEEAKAAIDFESWVISPIGTVTCYYCFRYPNGLA